MLVAYVAGVRASRVGEGVGHNALVAVEGVEASLVGLVVPGVEAEAKTMYHGMVHHCGC